MDASGRRYVFQKRDELTKNRREDSEAEEGGFMYERQDDPMCPVRSLDMYNILSKLNLECDMLSFNDLRNKQLKDTWHGTINGWSVLTLLGIK